MSTPLPAQHPGRRWLFRAWPVALLVFLLAGLNTALAPVAEWYGSPGGNHLMFAGFVAFGIICGQFCTVFLLAGLWRRTALGGLTAGTAIASVLCIAALASFLFMFSVARAHHPLGFLQVFL